MNYIILDLEWNQGYQPAGDAPKVPMFEITEIGAVKFNKHGQPTGNFHAYIYPNFYQKMNHMSGMVTGLSIEKLKKQGEPFEAVMKKFMRWCGTDFMFCTWGCMDLTELQTNCDYYGITGFFDKPLFYYDLQKIFSLQYEDGKSRRSLKSAVEFFGFSEKLRFHGAYSDAVYTSLVFKKLDMKKYGEFVSVDYHNLPSCKSEEIYLKFDTYSKYISMAYKDRDAALEDKDVTSLVCYECGRRLRKKIQWFTPNGRFFLAVGCCAEHGWLKGKIRIKKAAGEECFVVKTEKLVDEEQVQAVRKKQLETRKRRSEIRKRHNAAASQAG